MFWIKHFLPEVRPIVAKLTLWLAVGVAVVAASLLAGEAQVAAQPGGTWDPVKRVLGYRPETLTPILLADQDRTVHAFNTQLVQDKVALVYRRWTLAKGWTDPVDVLVPPVGGWITLIGVSLDHANMLHVVFIAPSTGQNNGLYYSNAPAATADRAQSWSPPTLVSEIPAASPFGVLVGDGNRKLAIFYSDGSAGNGLYVVSSSDGGMTWAKPTVVFLTNNVYHFPSKIAGLFDKSGTLHVVWTVSNNTGNGDALYYARLEAGQATWTQPTILATKMGRTVEMPSLIEHDGELFATYINGKVDVSFFMRRSKDGGRTWSDAVPMFPGWIGGNGSAALINDSGDTLHAIFGNRITATTPNTPDTHGMWHSVWQGNSWSRPEPIISGPRVTNDQGEQFDPSNPEAVVSQGNVLLAIWTTDPGPETGGNGVWYSHIVLNTPELPLATLPTQLPSPTPQVAPTAMSPVMTSSATTPSPTRASKIENSALPAVSSGASSNALGLSVILVILLIAVVLGIRSIPWNRR